MKIVSSAKISIIRQNELKNSYPSNDFYFFDNINEALSELITADILITYGEDLNDYIIQQTKQLKWIQVISAGIERVPFIALKKQNIMLTNAKGIHFIPMSEYTMAVILQITRKTSELYQNQLDHKWDRTIRIGEVYGSTLGIIGLGSIGQGIAKLAKAFNMNIIGLNTDGRDVPNVDNVYSYANINEVLTRSDFIIVVVPLTEETNNMIGESELKLMKETAYIINISRGQVVDENALISALKNKTIGGAVLDVFTEEPLPATHEFWSLENCIITPHLSGRSPMYMERALDIFQYNLERYLLSDFTSMKNIIDLEKGY